MVSFFCSAQLQSISGVVTNSFSEQPISGVKVTLLLNETKVDSTQTTLSGTYHFDSVMIGIYDLSFSHPKFESFVLPDVTLLSSRKKEVYIHLEEHYQELAEFVVKPKKDRSKHNNDMATNSVRTIYVQDMSKLAGSLDDPIRVAGILPGVTSDAAFSENFISIRGNSPRGLKYVVEGVELNNPTHFARIGSSGGTFTIFSTQVLDKSDFYIGAFPAEYNNALSGILDVNFRKGNNEEKETSLKIGTLGIDLTTEGPINKQSGSSFLINYRYSVVGLARLIGYPTQPTYQDLSFVLDFPKSKGSLKVFGIAGTSDRKRIAVADSTTWEGDIDRYNLFLRGDMASLGLSYKHLINDKTNWKLTLLGSSYRQADNRNFLQSDYSEIIRNKNEYSSSPFSAAFSIKHRFSNRIRLKSGMSTEWAVHDWEVLKHNVDFNRLDTAVYGLGTSLTNKAFSQFQFFITEKIKLNGGIAMLSYDVNKKLSIEPRIGITKEVKDGVFSLALGKHSQVEHFATYMYQNENGLTPNKNLDFAKAYHAIAGFKSTLFKNHYFNIEAYYQQLYDVPGEVNGTYSVFNISELEEVRPLSNIGEGKNYGIDLSLERYASKGLYYMINASLYQSHYKDGNGDWRSTEFDQRFNIKFLAGKEYIIGEKKNKRNFIGWNTNLAYVGGRPYTPIDIASSMLAEETILNEPLAYTLREDNLLFLDVTLTYKINKKGKTGIWSLQIKNLFSNGNAIYREYDSVLDKEVTIPSSSFFPNLSYKIEF